jgi:hypothetical protein
VKGFSLAEGEGTQISTFPVSYCMRKDDASNIKLACNIAREPSVKLYITIDSEILIGRKEIYLDDTLRLVSKTIPFPTTSE